MYVIVGISIRL